MNSVQSTYLVLLERYNNGTVIDEDSIYVYAATEEGAGIKAMEYYIEDGWEVIDIPIVQL